MGARMHTTMYVDSFVCVSPDALRAPPELAFPASSVLRHRLNYAALYIDSINFLKRKVRQTYF